MTGPKYTYNKWEQFEEVNIILAKKIARAAK